MAFSSLPSLHDRPLSKRGRTEDFCKYFSKPKETFPRYHVIHCETAEKNARTISPFVVSKCLTTTLGPGYQATRMASGDLLLEVKSQSQYENLSKLESFGNIPISITPHRSLNTSRGVVSDQELLGLTEGELLEGWKDQQVTQVQRIKIRRDKKEIPTKHIIVAFCTSTLPEHLETGYLKLNVRPYIPNPRRCFKCQRFGHGSQSCRGQLTCGKCATTGHATDECKVEDGAHCANCDGAHPAYSRTCPTWKKEKEIVTIKITQNITFREARQQVSGLFTNKPSFSDVVQQGAALQRPAATAHARHSVPRRSPMPPPTAGTAKAALPLVPTATTKAAASSCSGQGIPAPKEVPSTSSPRGPKVSPPEVKETPGSADMKASSHQARSQAQNISSQMRARSASEEAMDTTAPLVQKDRRSSLERAKRNKKPITGPGDGPVL